MVGVMFLRDIVCMGLMSDTHMGDNGMDEFGKRIYMNYPLVE